jgi:hypothetical protein
LARGELAEAERRLNASPRAILPAFVPLGPLRLDPDRLDRNANRPFDPAGEVSPLRRRWAIWRWAHVGPAVKARLSFSTGDLGQQIFPCCDP